MLSLVLSLNSCFFFFTPRPRNLRNVQAYSAYEPIYMSRSELSQSVQNKSPQPLMQPGKIYTRPPYLFINDRFSGIHIIDNSNPANPIKRGFISIPGNVDVAVKGNILYADNATDLVSIDVSNPTQPRLVNRQQGIFPNQATAPDGYVFYPNDNTQVIVGWRRK